MSAGPMRLKLPRGEFDHMLSEYLRDTRLRLQILVELEHAEHLSKRTNHERLTELYRFLTADSTKAEGTPGLSSPPGISPDGVLTPSPQSSMTLPQRPPSSAESTPTKVLLPSPGSSSSASPCLVLWTQEALLISPQKLESEHIDRSCSSDELCSSELPAPSPFVDEQSIDDDDVELSDYCHWRSTHHKAENESKRIEGLQLSADEEDAGHIRWIAALDVLQWFTDEEHERCLTDVLLAVRHEALRECVHSIVIEAIADAVTTQ